MEYQWDFDLGAGDIVCIENHRLMDIMLLNDDDYEKYKTKGGIYQYGNYDPNVSPTKITIPSPGHWYVVIKDDSGRKPPRVTVKRH